MQEPKSQTNTQYKYFSYKLLSRLKINQHNCRALSIDDKKNLVFFSTQKGLQIYQLKNGMLKQLSQINSQKDVSVITTFMNRSLFLTGQYSSSIIVWSYNLMFKGKYLMKMKKHAYKISCLIIYPNPENLIISGSHDNTIKFWYLTPSSSFNCYQTIKEQECSVLALSLNQKGDTLISCDDYNLILIMNGSYTSKWQVKQKIKLKGERLTFLSNHSFAIQHRNSEFIFFYGYDYTSEQYVRINKLQIKGWRQHDRGQFFQYFIPSKQILLSKNGYTLNLIRFTLVSSSYCECYLEQSIEFQQNSEVGGVYGTMSKDGQFLITYDDESCEIQIRKYVEKI
ncbi:unnamed protein product [Paramecium primaurelia]|uniref:Uncharacterized protein n=1 Tax=Paramecium primaurelia TaxID=5886 RepID=A0A8S1P1J3_PARPR|nr:unnamed protein product [Paramecium primaurelia]